MRPPFVFSSVLVATFAGLLVVEDANAQFVQQWRAGIDNGSNSDFAQENGLIDPAPGSATVKDDDWYFAGTYAAPIGAVAADENLQNFERALTIGDPVNRIHFNLPSILTLEGTEFRVVIDTVSNNSSVTTSPIPFTVEFNGVQVFSGSVNVVAGQTFTTNSFFVGTDPGEVFATTGDNVVALSRSTTSGAGWMQFDHVTLQAVPEPSAALSLAAGTLVAGVVRRRRTAR